MDAVLSASTDLPDREAWLAARRSGIGSSDAPAILGLTKWRSSLQVYAEKAGLINPSVEETDAQRWGKLLEPVIAAEYERETKRTTYDPGPFTIQRCADAPFMLATLDRLVVGFFDATTKPPVEAPGVLELKTASVFKREEWHDEPPLMYQVQLQHQLAVTGHLWGSLAVLIGGQSFYWADIKRNDAFIDKLMLREAEFWERIQQRRPPPPDGSKASRETLQALYPKEEIDDTVRLGAEALSWDAEREAGHRVIKIQEDIIDEIDNKLRAAIGMHVAGVLPNGVRYVWKTEPRKAYSVEASARRVLRRKEMK